jgi:serine/threonine protein kinase
MPMAEPLYGLVPGEWVKGPTQNEQSIHHGLDYEIVSLVGKGSQSRVYRCRTHRIEPQHSVIPANEDRAEMRECSLKIVWRKIDEALQEAEVLQQLNHPAMPKLLESWCEDGRFYLSREYIDGISLETLIHRRGKLNEHDALAFACELLEALDYLHTCPAQLVHCDIKPQNLLVTADGLRLIDFGLAAPIGSSIAPMGSLSYSAPEQLCQGKAEVTGDLYSVGAVIYFVLNAKAPSPIQAGTKFDETAGTDLAEFIKLAQQCLDPRPSKRPQTANELVIALRYLQAKRGLCPDFRPTALSDPSSPATNGVELAVRGDRQSILPLATLGFFLVTLWLATHLISIGTIYPT